MAAYDWRRDGVRVACKSAQMQWKLDKECWGLKFAHLKLPREGAPEAAFDELLLAAYTPEGVHLFEHDLRAGLSANGKSTVATGQHIKFYGPRHEEDWRAALAVVLDKMEAKGCTRLASAGWDEPRLAAAVAAAPTTVTAQAYEGVPLAECSGKARGDLLNSLVRRLDEGWLHPGAAFEDAVAGVSVDGKRRGQNMATYDWQRDGVRVACKSAQLTWNGLDRWKLHFSDVKLPREGAPEAAFDELLLAAYTPEGVHLFEHDLRAGVSASGKSTAATGKDIQFYGPTHEEDWRAALAVVLDKMDAKGCSRLAFVPCESFGGT